MKKTIYLFLILFFIIGCQRNEVIKTHGISYLEKREKLIFVKKSNKNDVIKIFGQPSTKGMTDDNLWIYIERTLTRGKLLKLGRSELKKNNVSRSPALALIPAPPHGYTAVRFLIVFGTRREIE